MRKNVVKKKQTTMVNLYKYFYTLQIYIFNNLVQVTNILFVVFTLSGYIVDDKVYDTRV